MKEFEGVFKNQPEREHFAEYLTGLIIAERKTVLGINSEFAQTTDQSCLNRSITEAGWDVQKLNDLSCPRFPWTVNKTGVKSPFQGGRKCQKQMEVPQTFLNAGA